MKLPGVTRLRRRLDLARRVLDAHWFQPATAVWRIFEAEVVVENLRGGDSPLDLGCGDGTLAPVLFSGLPVGVRWSGLDLDPREVSLARRNSSHQRLYAASANALPVRTEAYDLVFSNSALEHMPDLPTVVAEVSRALRPGGRFVFTVPAAGFHRHLLWPRFLCAIGWPASAKRYERHLDRRLHHLNYLSPEEWRTLLERNELQVVREECYLSRRALGAWETLANATGGLVHLARRGRPSPREVQHSLGLGAGRNRFLGRVAFLALSPLLLWLAAERSPRHAAALYIEAVKARPADGAGTNRGSVVDGGSP